MFLLRRKVVPTETGLQSVGFGTSLICLPFLSYLGIPCVWLFIKYNDGGIEAVS